MTRPRATESPSLRDVWLALRARPSTVRALAEALCPTGSDPAALTHRVFCRVRSLRRAGAVALNRVLDPGRRCEWRAVRRLPGFDVVQLRTDEALEALAELAEVVLPERRRVAR